MVEIIKFNQNKQLQTKMQSPTSAAINNPFLSSPTSSGNIVDLFGSANGTTNANQTKASDDLLQLGNPFADMFGSGPAAAAPVPSQPAGGNAMWMGNGMLKFMK